MTAIKASGHQNRPPNGHPDIMTAIFPDFKRDIQKVIQISSQTYTQASIHPDRHTVLYTSRQAYIQTHRHPDRHKKRHSDTPSDTHPVSHPDEQATRQIFRHRSRPKERQISQQKAP